MPSGFGDEDAEDGRAQVIQYTFFVDYTLGLQLESRPDSLAKENQLAKEAR